MGNIDTIYCHFSYKRPKGQHFALFAVAFYKDKEGNDLIVSYTRAFELWQDQQYITAIQSYEHALYCIWRHQDEIMQYGVENIYLVTDNSALSKWIANPRKNPTYTPWMNKANYNYGIGKKKELKLNVGLLEPRKYEKSYKFCRMDKVLNKIPKLDTETKYTNKLEYTGGKTIQSIIDDNTPKIDCIGEME